MSKNIATVPAKSMSLRDGASDLRMLAQVERWMAMIREINRDQQGAAAVATINEAEKSDPVRHKINLLRSAFLARSPTCLCT